MIDNKMEGKMVNVAAVNDLLTQFMASMPGQNARAANSSLSSIGYKLKLAAKDAVKNNSLGWPDITNLSRMTRKFPAIKTEQGRADWRSLKKNANLASPLYENAFAQIHGFAGKAWGALAGLLVYVLDKNTGLLTFGFEAGTYGKRLAYVNAPLGPDGKPVNGSWGTNQGKKMFVPNVIKEGAITIARKLTRGFDHTITSFKQQRYYAALGFIFRLGTVLECKARPLVGPVFNSKKAEIPKWFADKFWERLRSYNQPGKIINQTWKVAA